MAKKTNDYQIQCLINQIIINGIFYQSCQIRQVNYALIFDKIMTGTVVKSCWGEWIVFYKGKNIGKYDLLCFLNP